MAISINQMRTVLEAGEAVPRIIKEALPALDGALTKLDDFAGYVKPQPVEVQREIVSGRRYVAKELLDEATGQLPMMDMPWNDAAVARVGVRSAIGSVEKTLGRVEASGLRKPQAGPPPQSVVDAQAALRELRVARAHLDSTLRVWAGPWGGAHAQLVPDQVARTSDHLRQAKRLMESALRRHVNG